jgi:hypothetical protein
MTKNEGAGEHPLFRAMVVMGGSLAVGCGGTTAMGESTSGPHTGSSSGGAADMADAPGGGHGIEQTDVPSAGGSAGTNTPGSGGNVSIGTGGSGAVASGSGGTTGAGGTPAGGASEGLCSRAQLSCDPETLRCGLNGRPWDLGAGCACDPKRPSIGADCAADQLFVCRDATNDSNGQMLSSGLTYFDCTCVPKTDDCSNACKAAYPSPHADGFDCHVAQGPTFSDVVLCGCGFVYLR